MTVMDENGKSAEQQRRTDLLERLRMRFYQYQKQHNDSAERYASNEVVKEEKERQENHMYQQRILSARAGPNKTVPKPRLDLNSGRTSLNETGLNNNLGGEQAMILQTLKRRFTENANQSLSTAHSQQPTEDNPSKKPSVGRAINDEEDLSRRLVNKNDNQQVTSTIPLSNVEVTSSTVDLPARSETGSSSFAVSSTNNKPTNMPARTTADVLANTKSHGTTSEANGRTSQSQAIGPPGKSQSNYNSGAKTSTEHSTTVTSSHSTHNLLSFTANENTTALKNDFRQISGDGLGFNIERDLADFEDVFRNISENNESSVEANRGGEEAKMNLKASKREKATTPNAGLNGIHKHGGSSSGGGQGGMPHLSHFEGNTFTTSQPLMSPHFSAAPNQTQNQNKAQQQQQQQQQSLSGPRSMAGGGYPNLPVPTASAQQFGGRANARPNTGTTVNTKNPEIVEKLQHHLMQQQRRKQLQAVASPAGMQAAMQQHQYRQRMMNYMQQSPKTRMPPMSPSMPQNYRQHPVASPVDQMQQNPFHFQPDYSMYLEQQKIMHSPDAMSLQSPTMNGPRMPPGYFPHGQDPNYGMVQSPMYAASPQQRPTTPTMFPSGNTMRQHMMSSAASMGMMGGQSFPQGMYQPNPNIPQRLPPQYNDSSFHYNQMPVDNQPASHSQVQLSSSRLSHFMTPDNKEVTGGLHGELKSPSHMGPPYSANAVSMQQQQQQQQQQQHQQQQQQRNKMYNGAMKQLDMNDSLPKYPQGGDYQSMQQTKNNNAMMRFNGQIASDQPPQSNTMGQYFAQDQLVPQTSSLVSQLAQLQSSSSSASNMVETKPKQELFTPMPPIEQDVNTGLTLRQADSDLETLLNDPPQDFDLVKMLGHDI